MPAPPRITSRRIYLRHRRTCSHPQARPVGCRKIEGEGPVRASIFLASNLPVEEQFDSDAVRHRRPVIQGHSAADIHRSLVVRLPAFWQPDVLDYCLEAEAEAEAEEWGSGAVQVASAAHSPNRSAGRRPKTEKRPFFSYRQPPTRARQGSVFGVMDPRLEGRPADVPYESHVTTLLSKTAPRGSGSVRRWSRGN